MTDTTPAPAAADATPTPTLTATPAPRPDLPDQLSTYTRSPHHIAAVFEHAVGIRINGKERFDVEAYCISEGWIKVPVGKKVDRQGFPLTVKLKGVVEAFYK